MWIHYHEWFLFCTVRYVDVVNITTDFKIIINMKADIDDNIIICIHIYLIK